LRRLAFPAACGLTALAVVAALADDAGYSAGTRLRFGIAAVLAAGAAALHDPPAALRALRSPPVAVLLVLGALGAVSAAWTVGGVDDALRWGLVTAGLGAIALATATLVTDERRRVAAAVVLTLAAVGIAIAGLVAAADTTTPLAHREAGLWRPASTFQYSPALALLMVGALPALLRGMWARTRSVALPAALGAAVAGAVLGLAASRTELVFAGLVCAAAVAWPRRTLGATTSGALAAVALTASAALSAYAVDGGYVVVTPPPDGTLRLWKLAAVLVVATALWALARPLLARRGRAALVAVAVLALAGPVAAATKPPARLQASQLITGNPSFSPPSPKPKHLDAVRDRLLHGRLKIWKAAWRTFEDRPLHGGGADSFATASEKHQQVSLYAHDLPLELAAELGIAGLLLALALYAAGGRLLWRVRHGAAMWLFGPAAAAFLAANLVDWPWHFAGSGAVWAASIGALMARSGTAPSAA
jgi:hypothetical protein